MNSIDTAIATITIKMFCVRDSIGESWTIGDRRARLSAMMCTLQPRRCLIFLAALHAGNTGFALQVAPSAGATAAGDPFAYCARVGTIDEPAGGASPLPPVLWARLRAALGLPETALASNGYRWRCMDGAVYVCATGANIPCATKADISRHSAGADNYCRENREAASVPAYATGHETIYSWSCASGVAVPGAAAKLDRRGYRIDFWRRLPLTADP